MRRKLNKAEEIELDVLAEYEAVMGSGHNSRRSTADSMGHNNGAAGGYKFGGIDPQPLSSTPPTPVSAFHAPPTSPVLDPTYSFPSNSAGLSQSTLDGSAHQTMSASASSLPSSDSIDPRTSPTLSHCYQTDKLSSLSRSWTGCTRRLDGIPLLLVSYPFRRPRTRLHRQRTP